MGDRPVLVLGATGVFGSRACRLLRRHGASVVAAARDAARLDALAAETGVTTAVAELPGGLETLLRTHRPAVVIDTCGPFQERDFAVPRACIAAGVPYLDISDGREDVAAIGTLNRAATEAGVAVISGASSVPGLSSAVVDRFGPGFARLELVETVIAPGNDAPRGRAVIESILSYVGRPIPRWSDGAWHEVTGWQDQRRVDLGPLGRRRVAACDVPDTALFPERYPNLRTVTFHAGLEFALHHWGLWAISWLVRWRLVPRPERDAGVLKWLADRTRRFGTDRGAMRVVLRGLDAAGRPRRAAWTLTAHGGDGPMVPVMPAVALALAILRGDGPEPGARPCLGEAPLEAITPLFAGHAIEADLAVDHPTPLFRAALGAAFDRLPAPIRALHALSHDTTTEGRGTVELGTGPLVRLARALRLLPAPGTDLPVSVGFRLGARRETWRRDFDGHVETSTLGDPGEGTVVERYGPLAVTMALTPREDGLDYETAGSRLLGVALPPWLGMRGRGRERIDAQGRFTYDVTVGLPFGIEVIRYAGWLALPEPAPLRLMDRLRRRASGPADPR